MTIHRPQVELSGLSSVRVCAIQTGCKTICSPLHIRHLQLYSLDVPEELLLHA